MLGHLGPSSESGSRRYTVADHLSEAPETKRCTWDPRVGRNPQGIQNLVAMRLLTGLGKTTGNAGYTLLLGVTISSPSETRVVLLLSLLRHSIGRPGV